MTRLSALRDFALFLIAKVPVFFAHFVNPGDLAGFFSVLLFAIGADYVARRNVSRYRNSSFRVDLIYCLFYLTGIYTFFVGLPLFRALTRLSASIHGLQRLKLDSFPVVVQIVIGLVVVDLFSYLWHRTVHTNRFLWAFHSIHHSQRDLTVATGFRTHFIDEIVRTTFIFVPLYLLNIKPHTFVVMDLMMGWILGLQHSGLSWSYGPVGRVVVSPGYHRIHHSMDSIDRDKNFAVLFPFWDYLFGTHAPSRGAELKYGVAEATYPESFLRQLAVPFIVAARMFSKKEHERSEGLAAALPAAPAEQAQGTP